jgi:hypothetical protein
MAFVLSSDEPGGPFVQSTNRSLSLTHKPVMLTEVNDRIYFICSTGTS